MATRILLTPAQRRKPPVLNPQPRVQAAWRMVTSTGTVQHFEREPASPDSQQPGRFNLRLALLLLQCNSHCNICDLPNPSLGRAGSPGIRRASHGAFACQLLGLHLHQRGDWSRWKFSSGEGERLIGAHVWKIVQSPWCRTDVCWRPWRRRC